MTNGEQDHYQDQTSPADAQEAFRQGREAPLADYFEDLSEGLAMIAELFDGGDDGKPRCTLHPAPETSEGPTEEAGTIPSDSEEDWKADLLQLRAVIRSGHTELIGSYLREAAEILGRSARALHPEQPSKGWRLKLRREGPGRRPDPREQLRMKSEIRMALLLAKSKGIKQESVIAELQAKYRVSRATIFRLAKVRQSQKKR